MAKSSIGSRGADLFYVAFGNPLRRDDGVAWKVFDALQPARGLKRIQATPELAAEIANFKTVVFIDASLQGELRLERIGKHSPSSLTHATDPAEVVALARALYGFSGIAWLCRIPGEDFSPGEGLSPCASVHADLAARLLADRVESDA
jgi:Ni,Fe-hydrogenase maturation factor